MALDVASRIVSVVGVFIVVVFGQATWAHLWNPRSLAIHWKKFSTYQFGEWLRMVSPPFRRIGP
jgi:hypothetical protein